MGIPILAALFCFVREVRRRFREGADDVTTYWIRVGATTGLVAITLQKFVDFSLQMPGNAVLFTVLAAIAIHRPGRDLEFYEPERRHQLVAGGARQHIAHAEVQPSLRRGGHNR